jgi:hypothetical protein
VDDLSDRVVEGTKRFLQLTKAVIVVNFGLMKSVVR